MTIIARRGRRREREGIRQCGRATLANCKAARTFPLSRTTSQFLHLQTRLRLLKSDSLRRHHPTRLYLFDSGGCGSSVIYNRRPITLLHLHMARKNPNRPLFFAAVSAPPQHHLSPVDFAAISEETLWRWRELCAFISVP